VSDPHQPSASTDDLPRTSRQVGTRTSTKSRLKCPACSVVARICSPGRQLAETGRARYRLGLPDEQQIELTVLGRRSPTSTTARAKAVDSRGEICAACAPVPDVAESVDATPVRRDLYVPAGAPDAIATYAGACDRIGASRGLGDADPAGSVLRVKRIGGARLVGETVWDTLPGFGARRQTGLAVTYFLKYRLRDGRQHWHTIGRHGAPWTPDLARAEAMRLLGVVATGGDPARSATKTVPTVAELAARFLAEHVETKRKPRTAREYRRLLEGVIIPAFGPKRLPDVTRQDVAQWHHTSRAIPIAANRTLALLSVLFTFAERIGLRPDGSNPCRHVERFSEQRRERFLSTEELARLGDVLATWN
jgi:hypothetical protein